MKMKFIPKIMSPAVDSCPLDSHLPVFLDRIKQQGYCAASLKPKIVVLKRFNRWIGSRELALADLDEHTVLLFFKELPRPGNVRRGDFAVLLALVDYLREIGVAPPAPSVSGMDIFKRIEDGFTRYLREQRGLSQASVLNYSRIARLFLSQAGKDPAGDQSELTCGQIREFVCKAADSASPRYAQLITCALRSFLRFLYIDGTTSRNLSLCVPTVAEWKLSALPKFLEPTQVEAILAHCDLDTEIGKRDRALLWLLARLGLRACEIRNMELNDIHWESGQLTVRGKGGVQNRLPIPRDVGEALANYLLDGRPRCETRKVFVRAKAPRQEFKSSAAVCDAVRRALYRAGLDPPRKGAHLLRHSLAVKLLRGGATIDEIAEVLRHSSHTTTEIYTKVDLSMLGTVAQP